jgi:2-oxo-4-hydroxy-4-carboxy-5-ureidoimidazoline decarboxylase
VSWVFHDYSVLLHQGIGLDAFNELPRRKAVHALYECVNSVVLASELAAGRPYSHRIDLFGKADSLLFALPDQTTEEVLQAYPSVGSRPGSVQSHAEQCSVRDDRPEVMNRLRDAARSYSERFGFQFLMCVAGDGSVPAVLAVIDDRMHNDPETERKVMRNEIAKINRSRLERMLGPESGYDNWI